MVSIYLLALVGLAIFAYVAGRQRGRSFTADGVRVHSLPAYHGLYT